MSIKQDDCIYCPDGQEHVTIGSEFKTKNGLSVKIRWCKRCGAMKQIYSDGEKGEERCYVPEMTQGTESEDKKSINWMEKDYNP